MLSSKAARLRPSSSSILTAPLSRLSSPSTAAYHRPSSLSSHCQSPTRSLHSSPASTLSKPTPFNHASFEAAVARPSTTSNTTSPSSSSNQPFYVDHQVAPESTALQVTDPLVIYRAKVARGELEEDEEQLRALVELRRINKILRDYTPPAHLLGILSSPSSDYATYRPGMPNYDERFDSPSTGFAQSADTKQAKEEKIGTLVKWLSDGEGLQNLGTPKGLMITGTPGTGKSMVMDIFYDSLPTRYKFRRHYHHLLLDLYRIIWEEAERRRKALYAQPSRSTVSPKHGTGVVWKKGGPDAAKEVNGKKKEGWKRVLEGMPFFRPDSLSEGEGSPPTAEIPGPDGDVAKTTLPLHAAAHLFLTHGYILLFDEIQLIDVASAGLLRRTLEAYWRLGGVVIGTSNRMPNDLYASNVQRGQVVQFLEILSERCPNFEMRKTRDFRREPFYRDEWLKRQKQLEEDLEAIERENEIEASQDRALEKAGATTYFLRGEDAAFKDAVEEAVRGRKFSPSHVTVYGRKVHVPKAIKSSEQGPSVCYFTFDQLCDSPLGPADYLTLASTYHTFVIQGVPQMTLLQKNQARRLITLLDAVYEAGCRLILLADSAPDDLFFPDAKAAAKHAERGPSAGPGLSTSGLPSAAAYEAEDVVEMSARGSPSPFKTPGPGQSYPPQPQDPYARSQDEFLTDSLIQSETLSEAAQDVEEGFRPNISSYIDSEVDETSPNSGGDKRAEPGRMSAEQLKEKEMADKVGFKHLAIFSGEDERFAYQRAVSRLFEMSHPTWKERKSWRPFLNGEMSTWRGGDERAPITTTYSAMELGTKRSAGRKVSRSESITTGKASAASEQEREADFADEASYEASTFPGRLLQDNSLPNVNAMQDERDWDNRGASNAGPPVGKPSFAPGPVGRRRGDGPPVLSEAHVWGVREDWGKKAGAWGQGAKVFTKEEVSEDKGMGEGAMASKRKPLGRVGAAVGKGSPEGIPAGPGRSRGFHTSVRVEARKNLYDTLKVKRDASRAQIKAQFYKLSKELHPDVNPSDDAKRQFQEVSEAYAVLGTESSR
ncbi:hypothetical protein IE53DRAFT_47792 [Violaceomyces palustris]|uniref:Uncharacterized protein n=1 Tax=Violaceomyces palustris TaxID=1673888 RepID=A0ACD0P0Q0_9BASI|nr:hypothetical protein IE53DRAFT_47792 [Violaceomyces palustris]